MRITYRTRENKDYWTSRWANIPADNPMENKAVYPLKYAELTVHDKDGLILEAGCGAGRILRYYHENGYNIIGIDFIKIAIDKLRQIDPSLKVEVGDITNLRFYDDMFKYVLAFGLYHNFDLAGAKRAIAETYRVLEMRGLVCASFRADNIQTRFTDWMAKRTKREGEKKKETKAFHKMNLSRNEFENLFSEAGFEIQNVYPVENMPFLYKFEFFRSMSHKKFDENKARTEGYRLSWFGQTFQNFLMRFFPNQFCNIYVLIAQKV